MHLIASNKMIQPLLLQAISGAEIERPPVWLMRQAGRYMKEYRDLKEKHGFLGLCRSPELAVEVTLQPIDFLDPDAAIIFSDILIPAEVLGFSVDFKPGPVVANAVSNSDDVFKLKIGSLKDVQFVCDAISGLRAELESRAEGKQRKAVIGFCGSPWTMACYLISQTPYKGFQGTKVFAAENPKAMHHLLETLTTVLSDYLIAQIEAGADVVQIFDSWGGILNKEQYNEFGVPYLNKMVNSVKTTGAPCVLYTNGGDHLLEEMKPIGADVISLDWRTEIDRAEEVFAGDLALQGNLDPSVLFETREQVVTKTKAMLSSMTRRTSFIANLGHGILQKTPPENAKAFVDTIKLGWS
jgi:uroporphyrinogen decarboxylase